MNNSIIFFVLILGLARCVVRFTLGLVQESAVEFRAGEFLRLALHDSNLEKSQKARV
jgi:hypothetical protein